MNAACRLRAAILLFLLSFFAAGAADAATTLPAQYRGLIVVDPATLDVLNREYDFTGLLTDFDASTLDANRARTSADRLAWTPGRYIQNFFVSAYRDQLANARMPVAQRIGGAILPDRYMNTVFRTWMPEADMLAITDRNQLRGGPFRLLAVVNRMDFAGDFDDEGVSPDPRALGEVHLVYGMVDAAHEAATGQPFPMVFLVSYRLPPVMWQGTDIVLDPRFSQRDVMTPSIWSWKMAAWATLWRRLMTLGPGTPAYVAAVRNILQLAATPDNFIHVRSNTQVNDAEWELREWYQLAPAQTLINRKLRHEPYHCSSSSSEITSLVNTFWKPADNDLDMRSRDPSWTRGKGLNGWVVPRDNSSPLLGGATAYSRCGTGPTTSPYAMYAAASAIIPRDQVVFKAPFARANSSFIWRLASGVEETKRHAFAVRTCTGCHGRETGTTGFHISPRLDGQEAQLSAFMTGAAGNSFSIRDQNGIVQTYTYNELEARRVWFAKFLNRTAQQFDSLLRPERK